MKTLKSILSTAFLLSLCVLFTACPDPEPDMDSNLIIGTWYGEIDREKCELIFNSDGTATLYSIGDNAIWKYNYTKKDNTFTLRITKRPNGFSDDWDRLRVEYVNENRILIYSDFGDGDDRQYGSMTKNSDSDSVVQTSDPIIGTWYGNFDYYYCELTFNSNGTATLFSISDNAVWKYNYTKKDKTYTLRITKRPDGFSDDLDKLRVEYVSENRVLVYSDFGDGDDRLYGAMTKNH